MPTKDQLRATFDLLAAMAGVIRVKGEIPSGELYALVMSKLDIHAYNAILSKIKGSGLVTEKNGLLKWVGPRKF